MLRPNDHVLDFVDDYLHEVLDSADAEYVERHSGACPICKVALHEARKRFAALEAVPPSEASGQLIQATVARIGSHIQSRRRRQRVLILGIAAPLAACVAIFSSMHLYYLNLSVTPYSLEILGQSTLLAGTSGSLRVRVVHHQTGAPLEGVPVEIDLLDRRQDREVHLCSFTTDAEGSGQPRFDLPDWTDGNYELSVVARPQSGTEVLTETVRLKRSWKVMLTSDKPVYQPGQTIHVRALSLRHMDLKPVAGQTMTFSITDPKRNVIFKQTEPTSKFGIASINCALAAEIIEGPYTIACQLGDTNSQVTVDVKKYVLPKFKVDVALDQPYYQPGQKVRGTVHAVYFFGKPVVSGEVKVEVATTDVRLNVIRDIKARTDNGGDAKFEFLLPDVLVGAEQNSGDARFAVDVVLTDTAGQKQSKRVSRTVTANPIHIEVIPETQPLVQHQSNIIYFYTSYPDGRPARTRVVVSSQKEEHVTNSLGVTSFPITPDALQLDLTIRATDDQGRVGRKHVGLDTRTFASDFLIRTDRAVYSGGETMKLVAISAAHEPVFVDLLKDGQTILTDAIDMAEGSGAYELDLPPDLFGTLELCAYRYDASGVAIRKSRAVYVRPVRGVEIKATLERPEYRPGMTAKLQLALESKDGKPVPGALSLAAVDEAVYSVQTAGMERTFYLLEKELLAPIYEIYSWSPDESGLATSTERIEFEQALFARTVHEKKPNASLRQLLPFVDNDERIFEVLKRPDWEQLVDKSNFLPGTIELLRGGNAPHTLSVTTFVAKSQQVEARRRAGLEAVHFFWCIAGVCLAIAVLVIVVNAIKTIVEAVVVVLIILVLVGLMLPGMQKVREASNRLSAANALHQLGLAAANYHDAFAQFPVVAPDAGSISPARVRERFPETLLWRPEVITDDNGRASIDVDLADSITTWRLMASAVTADGRLGATQAPIRVFQPFFVDLNLPVSLTRGDEVAIPVVVYNYLDKPQTVELTLDKADWFERLDDAGKRLELKPNEVRSTSYRLRAKKAGNFELQVTARGSGVADAIKKQIEIIADGRRVEQVVNGTLQNPAELALAVPENAIEGSSRVIVKIYPSTFSQLVEGLEAIFQMPYGCFEQTSSTTYPNVLALDYIRRTGKNAPAIEARARQYIHLGYQRLLGFEVEGGGFDWFGRPPANRTLTAYGLMEFQDMARVHDVDPNLVARTRQWLVRQRNRDGSWTPESHQLHDDPTRRSQSEEQARLATTAYIAWAMSGSSEATDDDGRVTYDYLVSCAPSSISDAHVLALVANAILGMDSSGRDIRPYLARLDALKRVSTDGKQMWWEQAADAHTTFYGSGRAGSFETTALATLALLKAGYEPGTARAALTWLAAQKDASGTWHSTQATVLALKALLAGTGKPLGGDGERRIKVAWGDGNRTLVIPADQAEVMQQLDVSRELGQGNHRLTIAEKSGTAAGYQIVFRYHVPGDRPQKNQEPLSIDIAYDRSELPVGGSVTATATVVNRMPQTAPMVLLDLPIPPGFAIDADDLAGFVSKREIAKYQLNPRSAIVYLRSLEPGKPLTLRYHLAATMPVKVTVPAAKAYEYYDTDKEGISKTARLTVTGAKN